MAIEIVDLPVENGDFPLQTVSLPKGNHIGLVRNIWFENTAGPSPTGFVSAVEDEMIIDFGESLAPWLFTRTYKVVPPQWCERWWT